MAPWPVMACALLLAGCTTAPAPGDEAPGSLHPLDWEIGGDLVAQSAVPAPDLGQWSMAVVEATPDGSVAAFRLPVPDAAVMTVDLLGREFRLAALQLIPLAFPENASEIQAWGFIQGIPEDECTSPLESSVCPLLGSLFSATHHEGDWGTPSEDWPVTERPRLVPSVWTAMVPDSNIRSFVLAARANVTMPFGLLLRFVEAGQDARNLSEIPEIENVTRPVVALEPTATGEGFRYALWYGDRRRSVRTADVESSLEVGTTGPLGTEETLRLASGIEGGAGWSQADWRLEGGALLSWEARGELRGSSVDGSGQRVPLIGPDVQYFGTGEGNGGSHVALSLRYTGATNSEDVWYQHVDLGLPAASWGV